MSVHRPSPEIHPAVDWLKASAIVAVVVAHSGTFAFMPISAPDRFVRVRLAAFHVPVFLLVSGFLHATTVPIRGSMLKHRLRSIAVPYVVATLTMAAIGVAPPALMSSWPTVLLTGGGMPIYYFVPLWVMCMASGWLWSRMTRPGLAAGLVAVLIATAVRRRVLDVPTDLYWGLRDPLLQGGLLFYLTGWCGRIYRWDVWIASHRSSAAVGLALMLPWLAVGNTVPMGRIAYTIGVAWVVTALALRAPPMPVQWLASETLLMFLWHLPVADALGAAAGSWPDLPRIVVVASGTLATTIAGILVVRRVQTRWFSPAHERSAAFGAGRRRNRTQAA